MAKKKYTDAGYVSKGKLYEGRQLPPSIKITIDVPANTFLKLENKKDKEKQLAYLVENNKISEKGAESMRKNIEGWPEWKLFNVVLVTEE